MKTKLATIAAATLLPFATQAAEEPPAAPGYQLKNRSSFTASDETRAPFWPIGWTKRATHAASSSADAPVAAKSTIDPNNFKITSILLGSPSLAVINGRAYEEGEYLKNPRSKDGTPAPAGQAAPLRIRVQQITDSAVVLQSGEEQATVRFNRPGFAAKGPVRDLLLEDR